MAEPSSPCWLVLEDARLRVNGHLFIKGIDWSAREGEQWAITGANGAGKTVLAELATGRRAPAGGRCWLDPAIDPLRDIAWLSFEAQRELCDADTRHDISEYLASAVDTGTTVRALLGEPAPGAVSVADVAEALGISALLGQGLRFLSSGETRRVLLARILLSRPAVAVLDDPFEGIDAAARTRIVPLIEDLLASHTRVLFLSRRAHTLPAGISHVLELDAGRVHRQGPRAALLADTEQDVLPAALPPLPLPRAASPRYTGTLIELEGVTARYGDHVVLENVDLRLQAGEHLCLAGPNGCGKSTLLAMISGENPRAYGQRVRVCGHLRGDGESIESLRQRFGIVSNALHLAYPGRTRVADVVASGLYDTIGLYETPGPGEAAAARDWLAALGLSACAGERFDTLSFGLQRLVLVARAVAKWPPLLILDEPCSGLDGANRARVLALVDRIAATGLTQLLYVSHETEEMPASITRRIEFRREASGRYALQEVARAP